MAKTVASFLLLLAVPPAAQPTRAPWWNRAWPYRYEVVIRAPQRGPAAAVLVPTLGRARADGADVRVVGPDGTLVPHRILDTGRGDAVTIAFPVRGVGRMRPRFWIYFGNLAAHPLPRPYDGATGPILEIWTLPANASFDSWTEVSRLLKQPGKRLGAMPVHMVFQGLNPFGKEKSCLSVFTGWFRAPRPGKYTFAVNSVDAAFFFLKERLVVQWPGRHHPDWRSTRRHSARVELLRGVYPFRYVHASHRRPAACSLGVRLPREKQVHLAYAHQFVRWAPAALVHCETRDGGPALSFTWTWNHDLGLAGRDIVALTFRPLVSPGLRVRAWRWDYGDGTVSTFRVQRHVFLTRGTFRVRLEARLAGGSSLAVEQRVAVHPRGLAGWAAYRRLQEDVDLVAAYPPDRLTPEAILNAVYVLRLARRFADADCFLAALFRRRPPLYAPRLVEEAFHLAEMSRRRDPSGEEALEIYRYIADKAAGGKDRRLARAWLGALLADLPARTREARRLLGAFVRENPKARDAALRLALIKLADLDLDRGRKDLALRRLRRAQNMRVSRAFRGNLEVAAGEHLVAYEEYMANEDYLAAQEVLELWEWASPLDKRSGTLYFLRADLLAARGRPALALLQIRRLEAMAPTSPDLPSALVLAAACHLRLREKEAARRAYERILEEFPTSSAAEEARRRLQELGG